jgi:hypothetical protein
MTNKSTTTLRPRPMAKMIAAVLRTAQQPGLSALSGYYLRRWGSTIEGLEDVETARDFRLVKDDALQFLTTHGLIFTDPLTQNAIDSLKARETAREAKRAAAKRAKLDHRNKLARNRRKAAKRIAL